MFGFEVFFCANSIPVDVNKYPNRIKRVKAKLCPRLFVNHLEMLCYSEIMSMNAD